MKENATPPEFEEYAKEQRRLREIFQLRRDRKKRLRELERLIGSPEQTRFDRDGEWKG